MVLAACGVPKTVAETRLVCRDWARVGRDALQVAVRQWARASLLPRGGCAAEDWRRAAVYSAVALDKPHRLGLFLDALVDFDLGARIDYGSLVSARGYVRITATDRLSDASTSARRPRRRRYDYVVPPSEGLLAFAVGCGAVRCVEALAARGAPVNCTREALLWSAMWASTRLWRLATHRATPRRRHDKWTTLMRVPYVDAGRLVGAVLALPLARAPAGAECVRPLHALFIVAGLTVDGAGDLWLGWPRHRLMAWAVDLVGRFVRDGYEPDDVDPLLGCSERALLASCCAECDPGDRAFFRALSAALDADKGKATAGATSNTGPRPDGPRALPTT